MAKLLIIPVSGNSDDNQEETVLWHNLMFAFRNSVFFWNCVISQDEKSERKSYLLTVNQKSPWEIENRNFLADVL